MRHNNLDMNAKWTSISPLEGWQHFRIVARRYEGKILHIELMAACDSAVRLWLPAEHLKDQGRFSPGWTRLLATPPT
ncbi:MAG: TIGR02450 family Trp-rich protein [Proteobacteria bacterium]|nr:TIGR02450 family Trp-rich protein [Pseudomonadota bacterium]